MHTEQAGRQMMPKVDERPASSVHDHLSAELLLTSDCNMACSYCIARWLPKGTLSIEDGRKAIDLFIWLAEGASFVEITFTGGEPLLVFPVTERLISHAVALTRAAGMNAAFIVKTNGTIMSQVVRAFMREHRIKVVVSIDGSAIVHDRHRITKQRCRTHSVVLENLKVLMQDDVECVASITVHPDDCGALTDSVRQLHESGIEQIDVGPAYGTVHWSEADTDTFLASLLDIARYMRQVRSSGGKLEVGPMYRGTEHVGGVLKDSWGCHAASTNVAFMPNGQIAGCSSLAMLAARYPELIIGDIASGVNSEAVERFLELAQAGVQQRPDCQCCATGPNCTGGCLAINLSQNDEPFSAPQFYCRTMSMIPAAWKYAWDGEISVQRADQEGNQRLQQTPAGDVLKAAPEE